MTKGNSTSGDRTILYLDCGGGYTKAACKKIALDYTHSQITDKCMYK